MLIFLLISTFLYSGLLAVLLYGYQLHPGKEEEPPHYHPVSIIVAAHNEARHLPELLKALLGQEYPKFELVLALDRCTDQSLQIAEGIAAKDPRLKIVEILQVPEDWSPKKWVLEQAIDAASYDYFALTDADCRPGSRWLINVAGAFARGGELVLGASPYLQMPGFLNRFIRFETLYTAFTYLGSAGWQAPYMGVGRNIAYTRDFHRRTGGQEEQKHRLSGDDDLLVNKFARGNETVGMRAPDSIVWSEPKTTVKSWMRQKLRHFSASGAYSPGSQVFLAVLHAAHLIFYVSLILVLFNGGYTLMVAWIFGLKTILNIFCLLPLMRQWKYLDLLPLYPILDLLFLGYILIIGTAGKILQPKW